MGVKAVFGTMFPRKELIGYLTPSGMYRRSTTVGSTPVKPEKIHRIGFWSAINTTYSQQGRCDEIA
jgi:hypothetical protein